MRMICPTQRSRRARIHAIILKVVVSMVVSSLFVLPMMWDNMNALVPLMVLHVFAFSTQLSETYTKMLQHAEM